MKTHNCLTYFSRQHQVSAFNYDDNNNDIFYTLKSSNDGGLDIFSIDPESGVITVIDENTDADGDVVEYTLVVEAQDRRLDPIR